MNVVWMVTITDAGSDEEDDVPVLLWFDVDAAELEVTVDEGRADVLEGAALVDDGGVDDGGAEVGGVEVGGGAEVGGTEVELALGVLDVSGVGAEAPDDDVRGSAVDEGT